MLVIINMAIEIVEFSSENWWIFPFVFENVYQKITISLGKLTISMAIFRFAMLAMTRGIQIPGIRPLWRRPRLIVRHGAASGLDDIQPAVRHGTHNLPHLAQDLDPR